MRTPHHRLLPASLLALGLAAAVTSRSDASDFDVVINEIHYNPLSGDNRDEYVELHNRGPTTVHLGGWRLSEGIDLAIPDGVSIEPKGFLLVTPDVAHASVRWGASLVPANFSGRLDNGGEILTLTNLLGEIVSRVHYGDGSTWPSSPDGLGPSLELTDPHAQIGVARSWAASLTLDGSPGAPNTTLREDSDSDPSGVRVLVEEGENWRYLKGRNPYPGGWRDIGFNDASWDQGPTGIGYGDGDDRTELTDMEGFNGYLSFAARKTLQLDGQDLDEIGSLILEIIYDDGFVGYLNGVEIARRNLGAVNSPTPYNQTADSTVEPGGFESFTVPTSLLQEGENVLAFQVHNRDLGSSDASFIPRFLALPRSSGPVLTRRLPLRINEIRPTEAGGTGFVELFNPSAEARGVGDFVLVDSVGHRFVVPAGRSVPAGGFLTLDGSELGFSPALANVTYALLEPDGATWVDGINPRQGLPGENGFSFGRFPDGDNDGFVMVTPSRNAPNAVSLPDSLVINEFFYHPPYVAPDAECESDCSDLDQWIELHNRSDSTVQLDGWSLTKAVDFDMPPGSEVEAGGYLVIAASREIFLASHPGVDPSRVLGDWSRALSHGSDTINLRDVLGNLVDHVKYGDGKPINDEEPEDGVDDGTFRGSEWPLRTDGSGRTVELIHPDLENRYGGAWAAGPEGGTPGAANASFDGSPPPVIGATTHSPAIPRTGETVAVSCRVSAVGAISAVNLLWHLDGGGDEQSRPMNDSGVNGDLRAGDGVWTAELPAQAGRAIVAYRIEARLLGGETTLVPRPPAVPPYGGFEGPFYLYQVLDSLPPPNPSANYWVIMTAADQNELETRDVDSDVILPGTFIAIAEDGTETIRQVVGVRYRGAQTRDNERKPYRVEFASEDTFEDIEDLNLNSVDTDTELLAGDLFSRAGMPAPQMWTVNFTFQGDLDTRYLRKEDMDGDFVTRWFGGRSDDGNLYRAIDPDNNSQFPDEGDLTYFGPDPQDYVPYYRKQTNKEAADYSDIIELCRIFDRQETPDDEVFADLLEQLIDVDQWCRYFALQSCLSNDDGSIQTGTGEDYLLYRVPAFSGRPDAGKWILIPWDLEETFDDSQERLFRPTVAAIRRFLLHPRFAPYYYCNLLELRDGPFSRAEFRQRFKLIDFLFGFGTIDALDSYITARIGFYDENVPTALSAGSGSAESTDLIAPGDLWKYFRGVAEPSGGNLDWTLPGFPDASWEEGPSGFGYGDGDDATPINDMEDRYTTLYIRREFEIADPASIPGLLLEVDYDDGFIAYLNGTEVGRREMDSGSPGQPVPFTMEATGLHDAVADGGNPAIIDLGDHLDRLEAGTNVLAIQGFNSDIGSSDFTLIPELRTVTLVADSVGCGQVIYATGNVVGLSGRAHACLTSSVEINGQPASWDPVLAEWHGSASVSPGENTVVIESLDDFGILLDRLELRVYGSSGTLTEVSGTLGSDTTWSAAASPYLMTGDVTVPAGRTLTIEPGTIVFGSQDASIIVRGQILAEGTATSPILFRAAACAARWGGIAMDDTGTGVGDPTHVLRHCDFESGDTPSGFSGHVAPVGSRLFVDHSTFRFLTANAIDGTDARVEVRNSVFESIQEGVHCTRSTVVVEDCTFVGMIGDKDAIDFDFNGTERSRIERCVFMDGSDDGIDLGDTTVDIRDNIFVNIQDKALSLESNGPLGPPTVTGNIMFRCGTAIALKNGVTIEEGHHNTLVGNQEGLNLFAKAGASDGGHGTFHSMIVWNNIDDIRLDDRSSLEITFSDVSEALWPGEGNISSSPEFVSVAGLDFALRPESPCIGTGLGGTDMGAVPFTGPPLTFVRGDVDPNGELDITDPISILEILYLGATPPSCHDRLDANDDGRVDISDPMVLLFHIFGRLPPPPAPYPDPGPDPTPDTLICR